MIRGESKVTSSHLERTAIVYIRQSSLMQVREHTESTPASTGWPSWRPGWAGQPATSR